VTKGILSVSLLVVAVVGARCDQQQQARASSQPVDYFAKKRECYELVIKRQGRDDEASAKQNTPDVAHLQAEQCYVPTMNTCIYESGFLELKSSKSFMTTEDLLTGRVLADGESKDPNYKQARERLFALCAK
jgi:hypothetical protein